MPLFQDRIGSQTGGGCIVVHPEEALAVSGQSGRRSGYVVTNDDTARGTGNFALRAVFWFI
jgi:hypothetical protein